MFEYLQLKQMAPVTGSSSSAAGSPEAGAPEANLRAAAAAALAASRWPKKKVAKDVAARPKAFMTLITDKGKEGAEPPPMQFLRLSRGGLG